MFLRPSVIAYFSNFQSINPSDVQLLFRCYGQNGVMGELEPVTDQPRMRSVLSLKSLRRRNDRRYRVLVCPLDVTSFWLSREAVDGLAIWRSLTPRQIFPHGVVYEFSIYHLMTIDDPIIHFRSG